eukprot:1421594-Prymnesium_polylepis.2
MLYTSGSPAASSVSLMSAALPPKQGTSRSDGSRTGVTRGQVARAVTWGQVARALPVVEGAVDGARVRPERLSHMDHL